ncbi:hypothetical protein [Nannocystis punicea]|uniref:Glycoside hydrolase family 57 N-terminal domain-containing protein n=1 Tax=Nannocystis punicea TaxID=2995304 RepID=A0ABY7H0K8_9BACT|nr:hypothetical protein [Nannocystis poenicansa]WAS92787.1 hypothetical protein O0S08_41965 [Nannocystis poenicansa]
MSTSYRAAFIVRDFAPTRRDELERLVCAALLDWGLGPRDVLWSRSSSVLVAFVDDVVMSAGTDLDAIEESVVDAAMSADAIVTVEWCHESTFVPDDGLFEVASVHLEPFDERAVVGEFLPWLAGTRDHAAGFAALAPLVHAARSARAHGQVVARAATLRALAAAHAWSTRAPLRLVRIADSHTPRVREQLFRLLGPDRPPAALLAALPAGDAAWPGWVWSHAALGERLADRESLDPELAQALATIHARGLGVVIDLELHWPPRGRDFVDAPLPIDETPFRAAAERGLRAIGDPGVLELTHVPGLACPRPAVRYGGDPHPLPVSSPGDFAALSTDLHELYWRWVQPDWELALVRSQFPYVGRGFRLDLVSSRWGRDAIRGVLRATFAAHEPEERPLLVPRALLDGVLVADEWHLAPLAVDAPRIDAWREALARADADDLRADHVAWSFVRPEDERGPTRPIERHELPCASVKARHLDRLVLSDAHPESTWVIDTAAAPLGIVAIDGLFLHSADIDARGTLHALARRAGETRLHVGKLELDGPLDGLAARPFRASRIDPGSEARILRRLGDRSLLAADYARPGAEPRWSDGTPLALPTSDRPLPTSFEARIFRDGSALLVVGGRAHRLVWTDDAPHATLLPLDPLDVERPFDAPPAVLDDDGDGLLLLVDRRLCRLRSDGALARLFPEVENIMTLARGPGDAVIVSQGDDVDGDVAKVLWLATGEVSRLRPELLDLRGSATFACFLAARFALWCQFHRDVRVVPWELVERLPRTRHGL